MIALLWILGVLGTGAGVLWARHDFYVNLPTDTYRGISIRYLEGTIKPWPGLRPVIDALEDTLVREYPKDAPGLLEHLLIEVVPYDGLCVSQSVPRGTIAMVHEGKIIQARATGTIRDEGPPLGPTYQVLVVRQLRVDDSDLQAWSATGTSTIGSANVSAIWHEEAQHALPLRLYGDPNSAHSNLALRALEVEMKTAFDARRVSSP